MEKKYLFDEVALNYEKRRPNYGFQLFEDIIKYADITMDKSIIEIGCGTGQATEPFLKSKCKVTAVELGENLASFTRDKYKNYENLKVINSAFEDYECIDNNFDMLYSATAFHWIPAEIGFEKAYRILKNGGTLALFWNRPSVDKDDPLHHRIQAIYDEFLPQWRKKTDNNEDTSPYSYARNEMKAVGFTDIKFIKYHNTRRLTGVQYVELLDTYSDHIALEKSIQIPLYDAMRSAIEEFGNEIIIKDTVELYLGRKL